MISDLHVHLHGCLTPQELWNIGKDVYKARVKSLDWYASEYETAWGYRPQWREYWEVDNGFEKFSKDYLFTTANSFVHFQSKFNLIIALAQISASDFSIQQLIIKRLMDSRLDYFEARTLIPASFDSQTAYSYLLGLCNCVERLNAAAPLTTKLIFSLSHQLTLARTHYRWIREFIVRHRTLSDVIVGIDFAGLEEGYPPKSKNGLVKEIIRDNSRGKKLLLTCHVGESFVDKGLVSAIRWVEQAAELGFDRLGHCIALGVNPSNYADREYSEKASEYLATADWLRVKREVFSDFGFNIGDYCGVLEKSFFRHSAKIKCGSEYMDLAKGLQTAICKYILATRPALTIEVCPTSNARIAQLGSPKFHPLVKFKREKMKLAVGTDDPGILATDIERERELFANL